jgi:hypothetical protein
MELCFPTPVTEMSTRVKEAGEEGYKPYQLYLLTVLKCGSLKLPETSGPLRPLRGLLHLYL